MVIATSLRPVVLLMALASLLFFAAGALDEVYPGGRGWIDQGRFDYLSYAFGAVNLVFAIVVARGSERGLLGRMALAAFFFVERPFSAFLLGPKSTASVAVHLVTALVELFILLNALRVWRTGRALDARDLDAIFSLDAPLPVAEPQTTLARPLPAGSAALPRRTARVIGVLAIFLVLALVADGVASGFVPGGVEWQLYGPASGWLAYVFAVVVAAVGVQALSGSRMSLRLLLVVSLLLFVERPFSPFVLGQFSLTAVGLHALAAFLALGVALAAVAGLRAMETQGMAVGETAADGD